MCKIIQDQSKYNIFIRVLQRCHNAFTHPLKSIAHAHTHTHTHTHLSSYVRSKLLLIADDTNENLNG